MKILAITITIVILVSALFVSQDSIRESVKLRIQSVISSVEDLFNRKKGEVIDTAKNTVNEKVGETTNKVRNNIKSTVDEKLDTLQENITIQ